MRVPVALLCKLARDLAMGRTAKQAFSKIPFFPHLLFYRRWPSASTQGSCPFPSQPEMSQEVCRGECWKNTRFWNGLHRMDSLPRPFIPCLFYGPNSSRKFQRRLTPLPQQQLCRGACWVPMTCYRGVRHAVHSALLFTFSLLHLTAKPHLSLLDVN